MWKAEDERNGSVEEDVRRDVEGVCRLCDAMRELSAARIASGGSREDKTEEDDDIEGDDDIVAGEEKECRARSMSCWTVSVVIEAVVDSVSSDCSKNERSLSGEKDPWSSWKMSLKMVDRVLSETRLEEWVENFESKTASLSSSWRSAILESMIESKSSTLALRASMVALCVSKPAIIVWSCRWMAWAKAACCWSRIAVNLASSAEICAVICAVCVAICVVSCWID